ncbi:hypothetical protein [Belliella aquatica]|uniref:Uncharacterized protein n=1 Tax=Belliella aquatica TaxID=1323734 RepID=A0ABQ1LLL0_9BACT|nr:hypothetical protein [Belliella aquatica]MCH7404132.1 hypothetical protein [Belliella aquatica]GGC25555.1 hypothetical protein GCM10010993_00800 [Belliella aquatica]
MSEQNNITLFDRKNIILAILFCALGSLNAFAQGEKERNFPDVPVKTSDVAGAFESHESTATDSKYDFNLKQNNQQVNRDIKPAQSTSVRKENPLYKQGGDKEVKKEEMSTLSFNLFLYIVDKFREDN